jgi:hypothetical protein
MKVAASLTASKSKPAPDRPTTRLASDVTPAAIVTTAVARRCGASSFCAIIPLLLGPHAANLLERPGCLGGRSADTTGHASSGAWLFFDHRDPKIVNQIGNRGI